MDKTFVFVDVSKKQEFIFKSNKLKDNLTNSFIIKLITEHNESDDLCVEWSLSNFISEYEGNMEFCGGGNSIISFESKEKAEKFIRNYSRKILEVYPDLELYLSKLEKDDNSKFSIEDKKKLFEKAYELKEKRKSRFEKISFGVEKLDGETGFPIEVKRNSFIYGTDDKEIANRARKRLTSILRLPKDSTVEITSELQDYKKKDQINYIGIISLDGNGMGELVNSIDDIGTLATIGEDIRDIYYESVSDYLKKLNRYTGKDIKKYVTPIVSAGDDLCLILDGRIAIDAATNIIENIRLKSKENRFIKEKMQNGLTACAGVAIVKAGYPFFDAYKEAEKLCKKAKTYLHKIKEDKEKYLSIIDWKIVQGSNIESGEFTTNIKNKREKYHIKPLIIDKDKSHSKNNKNPGIFFYSDFKELSKKINEMIYRKEISKSTLKKLQGSFYKGYESYMIDIEARRMEHTKELFDITKKSFKSSNDYGVIKTSLKEHIYVLNDVIDSLNFLITID